MAYFNFILLDKKGYSIEDVVYLQFFKNCGLALCFSLFLYFAELILFEKRADVKSPRFFYLSFS